MKILVVGGAGYVGGVIVDLLLKKKIIKLQYLTIFYTKKVSEKTAILFLAT